MPGVGLIHVREAFDNGQQNGVFVRILGMRITQTNENK
jgi:hypothetical protein